MKYRFLLFDADNTLLDFDTNERVSIENTLRHFGIPFDEKILSMYHEINLMYWDMLSKGQIERDVLLTKRFETLFERIGVSVDCVAVENMYRSNLDLGYQLIPGALDLCRRLRKDYRIYIITNGVVSTQYARLSGSGLEPLMDGIFISDEVGFNKPARQFFEFVQNSIEGFEKERALVIGDGLLSDIKGGIDYGIDTCWVDIYRSGDSRGLHPTYVVKSISELPELLANMQ